MFLPPNFLPHSGVKDSQDLFLENKQGWLMDLRYILENLPVPVGATDWSISATEEQGWYDTLISRIYESCDAWVRNEILGSTKLWMLKWRLEHTKHPEPDGTRKRSALMAMRNYMTLGCPDSRRAMTRLLFSDHKLAVEMLRRSDGHRRPRIPRQWRLCRFCTEAIETEVHAILECQRSLDLRNARLRFWKRADEKDPRLRQKIFRTPDLPGEDQLMMLVGNKNCTGIVARLVADVFAIFDATEMWVAARHLYDPNYSPTSRDCDSEDDENETDFERDGRPIVNEGESDGEECASEDDDYYLNRGYG